MDLTHHKDTYNGFLKVTAYSIVAIAIVLVLMAAFVV
ncbi:MAG: aa3-type cytochrome c oxidase subunit IV [Alphaproteobacteria bacterium]|nr:aa3-type cytochrome c oxidase subunit IV [Alphaproteobacteria bacterium]